MKVSLIFGFMIADQLQAMRITLWSLSLRLIDFAVWKCHVTELLCPTKER